MRLIITENATYNSTCRFHTKHYKLKTKTHIKKVNTENMCIFAAIIIEKNHKQTHNNNEYKIKKLITECLLVKAPIK